MRRGMFRQTGGEGGDPFDIFLHQCLHLRRLRYHQTPEVPAPVPAPVPANEAGGEVTTPHITPPPQCEAPPGVFEIQPNYKESPPPPKH